MSTQKPCILSISGSDSLGGAGIQSDVKVAAATGSYAATVVTIVTAQNTLGVTAHFELPAHMIEAQIDAVFSDLTIKATKVGMCYNSEIMLAVAQKLREWKPSNLIIDPVMFGKLGRQLIDDTSISVLQNTLLPLADLMTPNMSEASRLFGVKLTHFSEMEKAVQTLGEKYQCHVLLKNINAEKQAGDDLFYDFKNKKTQVLVSAAAIATQNTHGTGSSLSAAIASYLSADYSMEDAILQARAYINQAIAASAKWHLGKGAGPLDHLFSCQS